MEDNTVKIQHIADLSTETEFNFAIFVGTEEVGSSVSIVAFRGTDDDHAISQVSSGYFDKGYNKSKLL